MIFVLVVSDTWFPFIEVIKTFFLKTNTVGMLKQSWQSYGMDCLLGNSSLDFLESTQLPLLLEISG